MMKNYPEMQEMLKQVATEEIGGSVSGLARELGIDVRIFVVNAVPRVRFMVGNLSKFLKILESIERQLPKMVFKDRKREWMIKEKINKNK